ncbi:Tetratricopeptide repeat protein 7B, partial [Fragariocoptes setiger]
CVDVSCVSRVNDRNTKLIIIIIVITLQISSLIKKIIQTSNENESSSTGQTSRTPRLKSAPTMSVVEKLEAGFAKLQESSESHSLLENYLSSEIFDKLKNLKIGTGATLLDVVQSGFENLDSGVGIYTPDAGFMNYHFWFQFGLILHTHTTYTQATLQAFKQCARIDNKNPLPMMLAARLCLLDLNPDEGLHYAMQAINAFEASDPKLRSSLLLSRSYLLVSIMHGCIYEREPESVRCLQEHHAKSSLHYLELAKDVNSKDYLIHFHLALHQAYQCAVKQAVDSVKRALELNPHHMPSIRLLLLCLSSLKHYEEALKLCDAALHEFTDDIMLLYIKCNLEQTTSDSGLENSLSTARHLLRCVRKAAEQEKKVKHRAQENSESQQSPNKQMPITQSIIDPIEQQPDKNLLTELQVWLLIADIYIKLGQLSDAESCISEASNHVTGPLSHQVMYVKGLVYKAKRNYLEAKTMFQSCIALEPNHAKALQQLAYIHHLLGKNSAAERFLKDSLEVDQGLPETWHYLGLVLLDMGQANEASECCLNAIRLESTLPIIPFSSISRYVLD